MKKLAVLGLFTLLLSTAGFGQEKSKPAQRELTPKELREIERKAIRPPTGAGFYIAQIEGGKGLFSVLLMEQHEWSLFVDVSKIRDESRLYVSLVTPTGKLTTEAGEINRASKKPPSALLLKMLLQVQ